jgi:hypothetical protein
MRTKTLLLSAVALAAGLVSLHAQSNVYSANVVGYCTVVIAGNGEYTLLSNPFDDGNGNQLTNLIPSSILPQASQCLIWDPVNSYTTIKRLAGGWNATTNLTPGIGFFIKNGNAGSLPVTNTFVGSVIVPNGGSVTNQLPLNFSLQGSPIPYVGNICNLSSPNGDTNMNFGGPIAQTGQILTWDPVNSYTTTKRLAGGWNATVTISPGQGFFILNKAGPPTNVVETLNLQ